MKKLISFFLVLVLMLMMSIPAFALETTDAADYNCDIEHVSEAVYMENLNEGIVVYEKDAQKRMYPASLTKIMTYIVVIENIPDFETTSIYIEPGSFDGLDPESSVMGLKDYVGQEFSVLHLLYGMMVPSGNDAAWVLAKYVGNGRVENFVELMNQKAGQLQCSGTHFVNPHGLYDANHYSTAYDIALMTKYALTKPYFEDIVNTSRYYIPSMDTTLETTNYMIDKTHPEYYYEYARGVKTGFTDEAGKCLVTTAVKDDYAYLCVALGAPYSYYHQVNHAMADSYALYEWAFNEITYINLLEKHEKVRQVKVANVWGDKRVDAVTIDYVSELLPKKYDESKVKIVHEVPNIIEAPIKSGDEIGTVKVYYGDKHIGTTGVVVLEDIEMDTTNYIAVSIINFIIDNLFLVIIFALAFIVFIVFYISHRKHKKKRNARFRYR